jgi:KDO2-lipid IV(A) lauroyltransferase
MKYRTKHIFEYMLLRLVAGLVCIQPYRGALCLGWIIAGVGFHIFGFRKKETLRRMKLAFGDRFTEKQYRHMAWISCRNMVFNVVDILRSPIATLAWCDKVYDYAESVDIFKKQTAAETGCIIAAPHMGCWDLGGIAYAMNNIPVFSIVARQRNVLVNDYFDRIRNAPGTEALTRGTPGVLRIVARRLKAGEVLAILPDARMKTPGLEMPLLGGTANLGTGMATFARMAKVPIFPIIMTREGWSHHRIRHLPTVEPDMTLDKQTDVHRMSNLVVEAFDREIHAAPEQWFWFNKRWVLDPVSEPNKEKQ